MSAREEHFARLDHAGLVVAHVDLEAPVAKNLKGRRSLAFDGDPPSAQEVTRPDVAVEIGEAALPPGVVGILEPGEERAEEHRPVVHGSP